MSIALRKMTFWFRLLTVGVGTFVLIPGIAAQEKSDRKVVKKVEPTYPPIAGQLHLSGSVKMVLQVTSEGKVASVHTVGGNPVLAASAEGAVKEWKFEAAAKESSETVTIAFEVPK